MTPAPSGPAGDAPSPGHAVPADGPLDAYRGHTPDTPGVHDESVAADGRPRPDYAQVIARIRAIDPERLTERWAAAERGLGEVGVTINSADGSKPYPVDLVPRILSAERWAEISAGAEQRVRALDAFLRDAYGPGEFFAAGHADRSLLDRAPGYSEAGRRVPRGVVRAALCGLDLVSPAAGRWVVLEDNVRMPGGLAMSHANRSLMRDHFPELLPPDGELLDPEESYPLLARTLRAGAPAGARDPHVVMVSPGPSDSTWFEQNALAERVGAALVTADRLVAEDGVLYRVDGDGDGAGSGERVRVDVLNPRMGETELLEAAGADGRPLGPGLLEAVEAGAVTVLNALGNGLADDKAVYALVPRMIEFYLGERPLLEQVPTLLCGDDEQRAQVRDRLAELVVKPIDGYGGSGITVGPECTAEELDRRRREITEHPERFVAQEIVPLSTLPTLSDGELVPSHVDLRVFVLQRADGPEGTVAVTAPTALTRVARPGTMIVNVSSGGGGKDTWIHRAR